MFVILGIIIFFIAFVIALISLVKEQKKLVQKELLNDTIEDKNLGDEGFEEIDRKNPDLQSQASRRHQTLEVLQNKIDQLKATSVGEEGQVGQQGERRSSDEVAVHNRVVEASFADADLKFPWKQNLSSVPQEKQTDSHPSKSTTKRFVQGGSFSVQDLVKKD